MKEIVENIILSKGEGIIVFTEHLDAKYCYFSIDTFASNYDFKEETKVKIFELLKKYFTTGNAKSGSYLYAPGPTYVSSPKLKKEIYYQMKNEVYPFLKDASNYKLNSLEKMKP